MKIKAEQKFIRISPRKLRRVVAAVKSLSLSSALKQLEVMPQRGSLTLKKTLRQAIANAINNNHLKLDQLSLKEVSVQEGPVYKRWQPVSRGRAHSILKRTSHLRLILESQEESK